jgi:hypothetical protein
MSACERRPAQRTLPESTIRHVATPSAPGGVWATVPRDGADRRVDRIRRPPRTSHGSRGSTGPASCRMIRSAVRLPGPAGRRRIGRHSTALDARQDAEPTDAMDADAQHVIGPADFLNRVRKFDSCRGHSPEGGSGSGSRGSPLFADRLQPELRVQTVYQRSGDRADRGAVTTPAGATDLVLDGVVVGGDRAADVALKAREDAWCCAHAGSGGRCRL